MPRVGIAYPEHIFGCVPGAAQRVSQLSRGVEDPLLDVAGHIVGSETAEPLICRRSSRTLTRKVAEVQNIGQQADTGGSKPVIHGGKALAGKLGVGRGFVPTDATDWEFSLTFLVGAELPRGRPGSSRRISKFCDRLFPGESPALLGERVFPVLPLLVPALVDKFLELAVGH